MENFEWLETETQKPSLEQLIHSIQNKTDAIFQNCLYDVWETSQHPLHFVLVNIALQTSRIMKKIININTSTNLFFTKAKNIYDYVIVLLQEIHQNNSIQKFSPYLEFLEKLSNFLYGLEQASTLLHTQDSQKIAPITITLLHYEQELYHKVYLSFSQTHSEIFH